MATIKNLSVNILKDTIDHKGMPVEVELEYGGVKQVIPQDKIAMVLDLFLRFEDIEMTPEQVIEKVRLIDKDTIRTVDTVEHEESVRKGTEESTTRRTSSETETVHTEETTERKTTETKEEEKESKIKVTGIGKTLLSLLTAGVILVAGHFIGSGIVKSLRNGSGQDEGSIDFENTPAIEQAVTEVPVETTYTVPELFPDNVIAPPVSLDGSENLPYVNGATTDWIAMSDAEYLEALNSQTIACQMNMPEISLFLEGEPLEGTKQLTNIQRTFRTGSVEYCIVEYFNEFRNEVVNAAYDTQNIDTTRAMLEHHVTEIYLFCTGQRSICLNTEYGVHEYYWNDLSEEAKNAVLDVLFSFAIALPHDYAININGVDVYPVTFAEYYEATLANLTLINPTNKR